MGLIRDAVIDMDSKGIFQWDSIYPNEYVINDDINDGNLFVYEDCGIIKGIIVLNEHQEKEYLDVKWEFDGGRQLVVHRLCIAPRYQGQGIARLFMAYAEEHGKGLGYGSIRLDAFTNNMRACTLYVKLGYKAAGIVHFRKGKFYCFEKKLG
jgi:GNAT superfamily N-acetyltransferase